MSTRKINALSHKELSSGETNGKRWAIYEITATTPEGEPIDLKLKSFDPLDGLVEVDVEKQVHEKYGTSYMLKRVGGGNPGARLGPKVDDLRGRIEMLEEQVEFMRKQISSLNAVVTEGAPPAPAPATYGQAPTESRFGDDVPF